MDLRRFSFASTAAPCLQIILTAALTRRLEDRLPQVGSNAAGLSKAPENRTSLSLGRIRTHRDGGGVGPASGVDAARAAGAGAGGARSLPRSGGFSAAHRFGAGSDAASRAARTHRAGICGGFGERRGD